MYEDDRDYDYYDDSDVVEEYVNRVRDQQIFDYLTTYGDAVQKRVDRCLTEAQALLAEGFPFQSLLSAVTAVEVVLRYFIIRPILEGAFLSEEWAEILIHRILTRHAATDRDLLPSVLRAWNINLSSIRLPNGSPLWSKFVSEILPLRNRVIHAGAAATEQQGQDAIECATTLLKTIVCPLSDRFGFSWSQTGCWSEIHSGVGGGRSDTKMSSTSSPFEDE